MISAWLITFAFYFGDFAELLECHTYYIPQW